MKHRHTRQQQRLKPASRNRRPEVEKTADEQPFSSAVNIKKHSMLHMKAEGGRTKHRLDKFKRGGRTKRFADGGATSSPSLDNIQQQMARHLEETRQFHQNLSDFQQQMTDKEAQARADNEAQILRSTPED